MPSHQPGVTDRGDDDDRGLDLVPLSSAVIDQAAHVGETTLRSLDAIHLASERSKGEAAVPSTGSRGASRVSPLVASGIQGMTSQMEQTARNPQLAAFEPLVGEWTFEATHPMFPTTVVHGHMTYEWLEGERFLVQRSRNDHPDFPDSISVIGFADEDELSVHYFDSRGVFRIYRIAMAGDTLRMWRDVPGFSQRMQGTLSEDGATLTVTGQLSRDDETWEEDLATTFTRVKG